MVRKKVGENAPSAGYFHHSPAFSWPWMCKTFDTFYLSKWIKFVLYIALLSSKIVRMKFVSIQSVCNVTYKPGLTCLLLVCILQRGAQSQERGDMGVPIQAARLAFAASRGRALERQDIPRDQGRIYMPSTLHFYWSGWVWRKQFNLYIKQCGDL